MKIAILSFTEPSRKTGEKIRGILGGDHFFNRELENGIKGIFENIWKDYEALIFISSAGIAVRYIAKFLESKFHDPAVLVVDDKGTFAISLLSGHLGGANELTKKLSKSLGAIPVITTASDLANFDALDVFARDNDLQVVNIDKLTSFMTGLVEGKSLAIINRTSKAYEFSYPKIVENHEQADLILEISSDFSLSKGNTLYLRPKDLIIGIGCRKGTSKDKVKEAFESCMENNDLDRGRILAIHTIDIKGEEEGILNLAKTLNLKVKTFTASELGAVEGDFKRSEFVKKTVGVDSVSSRAALIKGGELLVDKFIENDTTISVVKI